MTSRIDSTKFADGAPIRKADLRDTFQSVREELEHGGFTRAPVPGAVERSVQDRLGDMLSVKDFGAVGDGGTDDSAAFQAAIDTGRAIYVPAGKYKIRTALKIRPGQPFHLVGEYKKNPTAAWLIHAPDDPDTDEPLIHREEGWLGADATYTDGRGNTPDFSGHASIILKNLKLGSTHGKYAQCLDTVSGVNSVIEECKFGGTMRCVTLGPSSFDVSIINCRASTTNWHKYYNPNDPDDVEFVENRSWVFYAESHTYFFNCNISGGTVGVRLTGMGNTLIGARLENMRIGIWLGGSRIEPSGGFRSYMAHATTITGVRIESPKVGILCDAVKASSIRDVSIQGETGDHSIRPYDSEIGIWLRGYFDPNSRIENVLIHFDWTIAGILNETMTPIWNDIAQTGSGGGAIVGSQNTPLLRHKDDNTAAYHFLNTHMFPNAVDGSNRTLTAFHDLMVPGLTGLNVSEFASSGAVEGGPVFAKNLGGVAHPASGASSADVAFFQEQNWQLATMEGLELMADANSALEPGTYYYAITFVFPHAESSAGSDKFRSEVDVAVGESVKVRFGYRDFVGKRRIYRGRRPDMFDGYWETYAEREFIDDGTKPFDGKGIPPNRPSFHIPSRVEDDANYQIVATPSWHTTVIVTNKATTGFTLEFGTPAPDEQQTVSWLLFRP